MTPSPRWFLPCAVVVLLAPSPARADGYVEAFAGASIPVADEDYDDAFDATFAVGARAGGGGGPLAFEGSFEWAPGNFDGDTTLGGLELSTSRVRLLGGVRGRSRLGRSATGFVRVGVGAEIATARVSGTVLGIAVDSSDSDTGFAVEAGAGVAVTSGSLVVGGQLALPIGIHRDPDDPSDPDDVDFDYTSVDAALLVTLGTRF